MLTQILLLANLATPAPFQAPTTGNWYYIEWGKDASPWKPNPATLKGKVESNYNSSKFWTLHPKMLQKMQTLVNIFVAAEPKPAYRHHSILLNEPPVLKPSGHQDQFRIEFGDQTFEYDDKGVFKRTEFGNYRPFSLGQLVINGPMHTMSRLSADSFFKQAKELSAVTTNDRPKPSAMLYEVPPRHIGVGPTEIAKETRSNGADSSIDVVPRGGEHIQFLFTNSYFGAKGGGTPVLTTEYRMVWTTTQTLPVANFLTQKQLLDILEADAKTKLQQKSAFLAKTELPDNETKRQREEAYRATQLEPHNARLRLLEKLKEVYASTLSQTAIVGRAHHGGPLLVELSKMIDEETEDAKKKLKNRKYPVDSFFIDDPAEGYRYGTASKSYYANLKPGEVRSIQFETKIEHRLKNDPDYGRPIVPKGFIHYADAPGNIRNAIVYNFKWKAVKSLLGN